MEVLNLSNTTVETISARYHEDCYMKTYTVNGEEWVYIIHPATGGQAKDD